MQKTDKIDSKPEDKSIIPNAKDLEEQILEKPQIKLSRTVSFEDFDQKEVKASE